MMDNYNIFDSEELLKNKNTDKFLYHYTSIETGLEHILESGQLMFSPLKNVNDPYEYKIDADLMYFKNSEETPNFNEYKKRFNEIATEDIKVACFSIDDEKLLQKFSGHINIECGRGYSKPSMWTQYADENRGICLIFERASFIEMVEKHLKNSKFLSRNITYDNNISLEKDPFCIDLKDSVNKDIDILLTEHIDTHINEIIFKKNLDWSNEQEYRFIVFDKERENIYLPYEESLKGIVLGDRFPKTYINILKKYDYAIRRIKWNRNRIEITKV